MTVRQRRYSKEELARRGQELYESDIRQQVEAGNGGKIVAIERQVKLSARRIRHLLQKRGSAGNGRATLTEANKTRSKSGSNRLTLIR